MPLFKYKAKTDAGKTVRGTFETADEAGLYQRLRTQDLYLVSCQKVEKAGQKKKINAKVLAEFSRQIGTLLQAGVSLVRALAIVSEEESTKPVHKEIYRNLLYLIRQGTPLSEAMVQQGDAFPSLMIEMFRAAEASGTLDKTALRMADHYDKEYKLNSKVKNAMTYPAILSVLIVVVVIFLLTFVLPQFKDMFDQMEELPFATRLLYGIGDFMKAHWLLLVVAILVLIVVFSVVSKIPKVRYQLDKMKLRLPLFGKLLKTLYTARFARSLSSLYSAGLPIVSALQIGRKIVGNYYIDVQFTEAIAYVRAGGNLSEGLRMIDGFVNKLPSSIMIGEETGSLDTMLDAVADTLDYESEMAVSKMVTFLEPILIVIMAVIVGFIMIAVITPIYSSYNTIGQSSY